jgi:hypothetical protein
MPTDRSPAPTMTVVLDPGHHTQESRPVLELRGRLDMALFRAAVDRIAAGHPTSSGCTGTHPTTTPSNCPPRPTIRRPTRPASSPT